MQVARFSHGDTIAFGIIDESSETAELEVVELVADPMFAGYDTTGRRLSLSEVKLLAPVIPRSKIVAVGKNYHDHIAEMREVTGGEAQQDPLLFLKPNTSVIGPEDAIVIPEMSQRVEHEGELALVIGAVAKNVSEAKALEFVYGFTCANDVTARDLQVQDGQWARAKGFDTFCPLGPVIETDLDYAAAQVITRVNGQKRQDGNTRDLIHSLAKIVSYASHVWTLLPGDVILTGTPAGVGQLMHGDTVEVEIPGIGVLRNPVLQASSTAR